MILYELKEKIETYPDEYMDICLSHPFSWRGSYGDVAFSLSDSKTSKEENLAMIEKAISEPFFGWKGGEYTYDLWTIVHFEAEWGDYSDGEYLQKFLANNHNDTIKHIFGSTTHD